MTDERTAAAGKPLLSIEGLKIDIEGRSVIDGVDLSVDAGEIVAIVGESGCGKSLTAMSIVRLLPRVAHIASGRITLDALNMLSLTPQQLQQVRGNRVSVIFQEPTASLNPLRRIGDQVAETLRIHRAIPAAQAWQEAVAMLEKVGISDAGQRARQFPYELSGGMCQRAMIAAALILQPELLIADEPTTALDTTIQAQILDLLKSLRERAGTAVLLITHDMGVVADMADRVAVMYGGRVVETGTVDEIFDRPAHPYTKLLLATVPRLDGPRRVALKTISGTVPDAAHWPSGCRFRDRCPLADQACTRVPPLAAVTALRAPGVSASEPAPAATVHRAACWHTERVDALL